MTGPMTAADATPLAEQRANRALALAFGASAALLLVAMAALAAGASPGCIDLPEATSAPAMKGSP